MNIFYLLILVKKMYNPDSTSKKSKLKKNITFIIFKNCKTLIIKCYAINRLNKTKRNIKSLAFFISDRWSFSLIRIEIILYFFPN